MGFTLNSMTMLALTLSVGIVIDDAIVVLENIYRFIDEKHDDQFHAANAMQICQTVSLSIIILIVPRKINGRGVPIRLRRRARLVRWRQGDGAYITPMVRQQLNTDDIRRTCHDRQGRLRTGGDCRQCVGDNDKIRLVSRIYG